MITFLTRAGLTFEFRFELQPDGVLFGLNSRPAGFVIISVEAARREYAGLMSIGYRLSNELRHPVDPWLLAHGYGPSNRALRPVDFDAGLMSGQTTYTQKDVDLWRRLPRLGEPVKRDCEAECHILGVCCACEKCCSCGASDAEWDAAADTGAP